MRTQWLGWHSLHRRYNDRLAGALIINRRYI